VIESWRMPEWYAEFLDACNRHDLDAIRGFLQPSVRRAHLPGGADAWLDDLADLFHAFPDWTWRVVQTVADDHRIAVHTRAGGTHTGPYRGQAPTRRHVNVAEFAIYRLENGLIAAATGSGDHELREQIRA